jgi:hypothetical protein
MDVNQTNVEAVLVNQVAAVNVLDVLLDAVIDE